ESLLLKRLFIRRLTPIVSCGGSVSPGEPGERPTVSARSEALMMNRREWLRAGVGATGTLLLAGRVQSDDAADDSDPAALIAKIGPAMAKIPIEVVELASGFHLIQGPGGNIAVLAGPDGLTVVDSGVPNRANDIFATIKRVAAKPV